MAAEEIKKARVRASIDGKRLSPIQSETHRERVEAAKTALRERARKQMEEDKMSEAFLDTFIADVDRAQSLQELRAYEKDLDNRDVINEPEQQSSDASQADTQNSETHSNGAESTDSYLPYESQMYTNKEHDNWYFDRDGNAVIMDDAAEEEQARQMREPNTPPTPPYPKFNASHRVMEIPASGKQDSVSSTTDTVDPRTTDEPKANENLEDLLKRLASRTKEGRTQTMRENTRQPERARRNRDSHQDLHDLLTGAQDRASEENEGRATEAVTDAGGPPEQPPTDALRQSVGRPPGGGSDGAAKEEPKKNLYKIDQRNYIGLNIMSVQSIIHDPVHQQFFGELIHAIDPNANQIQQRYLNGGATPEDMSLMKYAAYEYSKWNKAWEDLVAHLTDTDVEAFMRRTEMLDNIAAHVGGTRGKEALMTMLRFTAMRDQRTFESIEHAVHEMHAVRDSYLGRLAEDKINGLARRVGINRDNFEDVFDFSTPAAERETHAHLVELFEKKAGRGRRAMDWLSRFSPTPLAGSSQIAADNAIADAKLALSGRFGKTGKKLDRLGATLKHASESLSNVVGTQEVIDQITLETITNERMRMGSEAGPKTFEAAKQQIDRVPQPELEKMITEKIKSDPHWTSGGASYQAAEIQKMKQNATNSLNAGTGFWAWFLRTLFATKFDKATINARRAAGAVH
jgi:hypothetical protein